MKIHLSIIRPMGIVDKSLESKLARIQKRSETTLDEPFDILEDSSRSERGDLLSLLVERIDLDEDDARTVVHVFAQQGNDAPRTVEGELARIYSGKGEKLRAIHDTFMERVETFGRFEAGLGLHRGDAG